MTPAIEPGEHAVEDLLGRPLHDLRISVTDRCNFRCTYCMPKEIFGPDFAFLPKAEVLSFEEIERVARAFVELGVEKLRITGGEPLVRRDLPVLISMLAALRRPDGGELDLTLTTNGSALRKLARRAARRRAATGDRQPRLARRRGLLRDERRRLPGREGPRRDRRRPGGGPRAGQGQHGRPPRDERGERPADGPLGPRRSGVTLRFIEYMDVGHTNGWRLDEVVSADEIVAAIDAEMPLERLPTALPRRGRRAGGATSDGRRAEVGVIASVSQPFCGDCTRARISAEGKLYTCLFSAVGHDLRAVGARPGRDRRRPARGDRRASGASATTATASCERRRRPTCRGSRCSRWAAEPRPSRLPRGRPRGVASACDRGLPPGSRRPVLARPQRDPALPRPDPGPGRRPARGRRCRRAHQRRRLRSHPRGERHLRDSKWRFGCWSVR